jgi:hypothetical protein
MSQMKRYSKCGVFVSTVWLEFASKNGLHRVRIMTGKGKGPVKKEVIA